MCGDLGRGVSERMESTSARMPGREDALLPAREDARVLAAEGGRWKCGDVGGRSQGCTQRRSVAGSPARYEYVVMRCGEHASSRYSRSASPGDTAR